MHQKSLFFQTRILGSIPPASACSASACSKRRSFPGYFYKVFLAIQTPNTRWRFWPKSSCNRRHHLTYASHVRTNANTCFLHNGITASFQTAAYKPLKRTAEHTLRKRVSEVSSLATWAHRQPRLANITLTDQRTILFLWNFLRNLPTSFTYLFIYLFQQWKSCSTSVWAIF